MKFGKLNDISGVDFSLPANHAANHSVLSKFKLTTAQKPEILIGCPSWSCKEWLGKIYPRNTKSADYLLQYGKHFQTIEMNTTYYSTPKQDTVLKWKNTAPNGFAFCPKISKQISHFRRLKNTENLTEEFCHAFASMEEKLGAFFLQLPPNFTPSEFSKLESFILHFPVGYNLGIELRHEGWYTDEHIFNNLAQLLESQQMMWSITDVGGRRDVLHQRLTSPQAMIRFVGNELHPTDYERIDAWVERLNDWANAGLQKVYFFVHEPDDILCPELAHYLVQKLKEKNVFDVKAPQLLPKTQQATLF